MYFVAEKGKSAFLLKPSSHVKRKRKDYEEVKEEEKLLSKDKHGFLKGVKRIKLERDSLSD